jgi:multidrug efflux pump
VSYQNGAAVKLADVANVQDSVEDLRAAGMTNGKPSVLLVIFRELGRISSLRGPRAEALPQLKASILQRSISRLSSIRRPRSGTVHAEHAASDWVKDQFVFIFLKMSAQRYSGVVVRSR